MKRSTTHFKKLLIIFFFLGSLSANAQYVTIPDANFVTYLSTFPGCMTGNQMDTTCYWATHPTGLNVSNLAISDLDGIQYFDSLSFLNCESNNLTSLPELPNTLTTIYCSHNNLVTLPTLPTSLTLLNCEINSITSLPPLPAGLQSLQVDQNFLLSLPTLPASLTYLSCGYNVGLVLPPSLPSGLQLLACGNNGYTSLPPLPNSLTFLNVQYNLLTSLPPIPSGMQSLYCNGNNLSCMPILPDTMQSLIFGFNSITCMPNYPVVTFTNDVVPTSLPLCAPATGCPIGYNIAGKVYSDINQDCSYLLGENLLSYIPVQLWQGGSLISQSYNTNGYYGFNTTSLGMYDVIVDTAGLPYEIVCQYPGIDTTVNLTVVDSIAEDISFGFKCRPGTYDMAAMSIHRIGGSFIPTTIASMSFMAGDLSLTYLGVPCNSAGISGTVQVTYVGPAYYIMPYPGSLTPVVVGNTLTYNIADFSTIDPFTAFRAIFGTDTTAVVGDQVCFTLSVVSSGTEFTLANNSLSFCIPALVSFDPNVKEVSPIGDVIYPFNNWLTYTVHFQNTGTTSAMNIKITDLLDSDLDASTFRLLNSSHNVNATISGNNAVFLFNGIMLPDSNSNEPQSHGFIQYKIKPLTNLAPGTVINNTADIYFDFNSPITTNITVNTIISTAGIESSTNLNVNIYPNPASELITIQFGQASTDRYIQLIDMMGRVIQQQRLTDANNLISLAGITSGIYSVKIVEKGKETVKKIVIQK